MTLPTRMLKRLHLEAAPGTAIISCSLQTVSDDKLINIPARVSGTATALSGNITELDFRQVVEQETISYVATFAIDARAGVRFKVTIADPRAGFRYQVDFVQTHI